MNQFIEKELPCQSQRLSEIHVFFLFHLTSLSISPTSSSRPASAPTSPPSSSATTSSAPAPATSTISRRCRRQNLLRPTGQGFTELFFRPLFQFLQYADLGQLLRR
mmetsp:Transcript_5350/g.11617  ORF Transcript_5350/g.11617 Transcript_5350/m.11617 type:complete len:106 (+) Transcript_5350:96-413(+)